MNLSRKEISQSKTDLLCPCGGFIDVSVWANHRGLSKYYKCRACGSLMPPVVKDEHEVDSFVPPLPLDLELEGTPLSPIEKAIQAGEDMADYIEEAQGQ